MPGTYLFFVTCFPSHCRALKEKEIMKPCAREVSASREICKHSGAEHGNKWAPTLLWPLPECAAPSAGISVHLSPTPSLPCHLCCLLPGSCPPAGNQKTRQSREQWLTKRGVKHQLSEVVGMRVFKVKWAVSWPQWPLGHRGLFPTLRPLGGGVPWPPNALSPGLGLLMHVLPHLPWLRPSGYFPAPFTLEVPSNTRLLAPLLCQNLGWAQRYKVEENTVLGRSNFYSTALVFQMMPSVLCCLKWQSVPDADRGALG